LHIYLAGGAVWLEPRVQTCSHHRPIICSLTGIQPPLPGHFE
jgi:hypothetical protein